MGWALFKQTSEGARSMGRGDRKTAKGKRAISSYGNLRLHRVKRVIAATPKAAVAKKTAASRKKA